ncbi:DUF2312 domain-containing protein [Rhizobium leguminosarum]|nr:DUF2312 domain-containing protein [Rhizobium leguminosarum]
MTNAHGVARDQLRAFIERIERLEEEKKTIADDIKDVYAEAKGMGFIPAMMKKVIALRKKDEQERMEEEAILDTYLLALGMIQADLFEEPHHPETGEIIDPKLAQTIVTGMQTEIGRKALIAAVDIMIAREEAEETQERPSTNDEASPEAGPQAEASPAGIGAGTLADREGRHEGEAATVDLPTNPRSDDDAIAAVKGKARLANVNDVEPSSSAPIAPAAHGEAEAPSVERVSPAIHGGAAANGGGRHVNAQPHSAATAGALVQVAPATKPLRPHCRNPGEHCGGYGSNHCHSCLRAAREPELEACT